MNSTERDLSEDELLPCPFCGWSVTADEGLCKWDKDEFGDTVDEVTYTGVCCPGCSASVPINAKTAAEAIAAWNKRPPADALASIRAERDAAVAATIEECAKAIDALRLQFGQAGGTGIAGEANAQTERNVVGPWLDLAIDAIRACAIAGEQKP